MKSRKISIINEDVPVFVVPLGKDGKQGNCYVDAADYAWLRRNGLSGNWRKSPNGYVVVSSKTNGKNEVVARIILKCSFNQAASYKDNDPLNLRRGNLVRVPNGRGKGIAVEAFNDGGPDYIPEHQGKREAEENSSGRKPHHHWGRVRRSAPG